MFVAYFSDKDNHEIVTRCVEYQPSVFGSHHEIYGEFVRSGRNA